ncbi:MAG: apolipoprotein A1/A4/E domain protein [Bacteroidales bacterium]|jgi:phage-related protein
MNEIWEIIKIAGSIVGILTVFCTVVLYISNISHSIKDIAQSVNLRIDGVEQGINLRIDNIEQRLNHRIDSVEQRINHRIDSVEQRINRRIDNVEQRINLRIDNVEQGINRRIDNVEQCIDDIKNNDIRHLYLEQRYQGKILTSIAEHIIHKDDNVFAKEMKKHKDWYDTEIYESQRKEDNALPK